MSDSDVALMWERFTWRILANHVSPWELEQLKNKIERWDQWCEAWSRAAQEHAASGDRAAAAGQRLTAGAAYIRAMSFYHWASFYFVHDQKQFVAALQAMAECLRKAAPVVDPPLDILEIPFENNILPAYLRRPAGVTRPPIVILCAGGDSTKEELYDLGEHLVARGIAVLAFDGPGQGLVSTRLKMRPDYEVVIRAVTDTVCSRDDLDVQRLAVGGISYGGLFACRAAAFDDRVRAVVSVSSWYSPAGLYAHAPPLTQAAVRQYFGDNAADVQASITMAGAAQRIKVPLLQVYGGRDKASPPEHAHRVEKEVPGPVTTIVYEEGVHVCNNVQYKARPLIADWLVKTLK